MELYEQLGLTKEQYENLQYWNYVAETFGRSVAPSHQTSTWKDETTLKSSVMRSKSSMRATKEF